METTIESIISPKFTDSDVETLKTYFEYNKKYYWDVNEQLTRDLAKHPLWGPILKMQTPEQQRSQNERSLELQRAAIYEGRWDEYMQDLIAQGVTYARMNVSYSDWHEIIKIYKHSLIPYIKRDFADAADKAITFMEGLSKFIDYAMYGIAEAYFREKNNIIKANEERFRAIFENSTDNICLIDDKTVINMINTLEPGLKKEDVLGKSILEFQPEENVETVRKAIRSVFENKRPCTFESMITREGKTSYYSSSVSPIFADNGAVNSAVVISRDVSIQKRAEAEVKALNADLEKKVNERTEELKNTNKELESFSYSVSHDLRTPLRAINSFTQILIEDYADQMDNDARDAMNEIVENATRMGQLIDDLLEFSRLGKQEVTKRSLDMNELVGSIITELKSQEEDRIIEFNIKFLEKAKADRGMLKQVMTNMISNAIKYSRKKSQSVIEIGSYKNSDDHVYYIKDNGAGFDMAYYDKLFGVFQRLHSSSEFEGTGVGLAIVQRIVAKHAGKVWAEGKVGEGATFYVSLPYSN